MAETEEINKSSNLFLQPESKKKTNPEIQSTHYRVPK